MLTLSKFDFKTVAMFFSLLFCFLVFRAVHVPILADEAFSYFLYIEPGTLFDDRAAIDANNHLLNSILAYGATLIFGHSTLAIRIPNLLFALLFFYASYQLAKKQSSRLYFWLTLITLNGIYPVIEFLSLARGYGMSHSLLLFAAYLLMTLQKEVKIKTLLLLILVCSCGIFAQLSLYFAFVGVLVFGLFLLIRSQLTTLFKTSYAAISFVVLSLFAMHISALNDLGIFFFGTVDNFPIKSLISLNMLLFFEESNVLAYLHLALILLPFLFLFPTIKKLKTNVFQDESSVFPFLLFCSLSGTSIAVLVLNSAGPLSRTGLYFFILTIGSLLFVKISHKIKQLTHALLIGMVIYNLKFINLTQVNFWQKDTVDQEIFDVLSRDTSTFKTVAGSLYLDRIFNAEHNIFRQNLPTNYCIIKDKMIDAKYLLLNEDDVDKFSNYLSDYNIIYSHNSRVSLYRKKVQNTFKKFTSHSRRYPDDNEEFLPITSIFKNDFPSELRQFILELDLNMFLTRGNSDLSITISYFDQHQQPLSTNYIRINEFSRDWKTGKQFKVMLSILDVPEEFDEIRLYLYNPHKQNYQNTQINYTLYAK